MDKLYRLIVVNGGNRQILYFIVYLVLGMSGILTMIAIIVGMLDIQYSIISILAIVAITKQAR